MGEGPEERVNFVCLDGFYNYVTHVIAHNVTFVLVLCIKVRLN
jgi:hypothetical protein